MPYYIKNYQKKLLKKPLLLKEEEKTLFLSLAKGNINAKKIIWERNTRLVFSIAKRYADRKIEFEDLLSIGYMALSTAIDKFDVTKGFKFSTFATPHIEWAIKTALKKASGFKLTKRERDNIAKFCAIKAELSKNKDEEPSLSKIAEKMGISYDKALKMQELKNYSESFSINQSLESIDGEKNNSANISDPNSEITTEDIENLINSRQSSRFLNFLTKREKEVLQLRFGLVEGECHNLKEIAIKLGVSKPRVHALLNSATKKTRYNIKNRTKLNVIP